MDLLAFRNVIESHGGLLNTLDEGYRDEDIDDEEMSDMFYEIQVQFDNLIGDMAEFMERLYDRLDAQDGFIDSYSD